MAMWGKDPRVSVRYPGRMEVEKYVYTPGLHGLELAKALKEGRLIGTRCGDTIYFPPTTFCPDHSMGEPVEIKGPWIVEAYTVVREDSSSRRLDKPVVIAYITPLDAEGGLIHYVEASEEEIAPGIEVEPVFAPPEKRKGTIRDILYFKVKNSAQE